MQGIECIVVECVVGRIRICAGPRGLVLVGTVSGERWSKTQGSKRLSKILERAKEEMEQYFAGDRRTFDVPLAPGLGTPFQNRVWWELRKIPYGTVVTYGQLASRIRKKGAARAVGQAVGANPIGIIVPCHRVVAGGKKLGLGGYGGGLRMKRYLLSLEGVEGL